MTLRTILALLLALVSTTLFNLAYVREQAAAAALPPLSPRRPLLSLRLLLADRGWLAGFAMEFGGFVLYVAAVAIASLALVQSVGAGGIGILAFASARRNRRRLSSRERLGVLIAMAGLLALAVSLAGGGEGSGAGSIALTVLWLGATVLVAVLVLLAGRGPLGPAAADGIAGGLLFSTGDIATKLVTEGGVRVAFVALLIAGYVVGTSLLQLGYQRGGALAIAGIATLLTNALPIAFGMAILDEGLPRGALGALRILAFAGVVGGAILLARPDPATSPA